MKNILFLHGGPGLQSETERRVLTPFFEKAGISATFWNEPSTLRTNSTIPFQSERAFSRLVESAQIQLDALAKDSGGSVHIVAHSFAARTALLLANTNPEKVEMLTLLTPAVLIEATLRGVISKAANNVQRRGDSSAAEKLRASLRFSVGSSELLGGLAEAFADPDTLSLYWRNAEAMNQWTEILQESTFGIDWTSQAAVMKDLEPQLKGLHHGLGEMSLNLPIQVLWGTHDQVIYLNDELELLSKIARVDRVFELKGTSHFSALEDPEQFLSAVTDFHHQDKVHAASEDVTVFVR
jgi:pimeloyl-ACP methyl ester carboxylesterase